MVPFKGRTEGILMPEYKVCKGKQEVLSRTEGWDG